MITEKNNVFRLENDFVVREIQCSEGGLRTTSIFNKLTGCEYLNPAPAEEFFFRINKEKINGYCEPVEHILDGEMVYVEEKLIYLGYETGSGLNGREALRLKYRLRDFPVKLDVCYEISSQCAGTVKWLEFINEGEDTLHLDYCFIDIINACPDRFVAVDFYKYQGLQHCEPMFATCGSEDVIQGHNRELNEGFFLVNTAPGPLKHYMVYPGWSGTAVSCGYNMDSAAFNKYLKSGEKFVSDRIMLYLYKGCQCDATVRNGLRRFIREELPVSPDNGGFMYCTWLPFLKNINEKLLLELADEASGLGFSTFVVDDGWFKPDAWTVDTDKFPRGIKVIADKVRGNGMTFGLWFNMGTDYGYPSLPSETNALQADGEGKEFGFGGERRVKCLASAHRDVVADKLLELAREYNVGYFKIDFSCILSPYGMMPYGCHSKDHPYHQNGGDAVVEQYASMRYIRDKVKQEFPELIIDFSFENFGLDRPTVAALQYCELHHATNMNTLKPDIINALKIRNTLYRFGTVLPNERILGSLICLQNNNDIEHLMTSLVGAPLVAGDLMKISSDNKAVIRRIASALKSVISESPMTEMVKLRGDMYIQPEQWDGFVRFNATGQGIICLFKNKCQEQSIELAIGDLPSGHAKFVLHDVIDGQDAGVFSAAELRDGQKKDWFDGEQVRIFTIKPA